MALRLIASILLRTAKAVCWNCDKVTSVHAFITSDIVDTADTIKVPCYVSGITGRAGAHGRRG
jgi:hypothetical protein